MQLQFEAISVMSETLYAISIYNHLFIVVKRLHAVLK